MMTKDKIRKTMICYWSAEHESFLAESAMMPHVFLGTGDTLDEAIADFEIVLDQMYEKVTSDKIAGYKMGRPAKGYVQFNNNIRPSSKARIAELAAELDISQGEVIDYLVFYLECKVQEEDKVPGKDGIVQALELMSFRIEQIEERTPANTEEATLDKCNQAELSYKLMLVNPKGASVDLIETTNDQALYTVNKIVVELSGRLSLLEEGSYTLKLLGKTKDSEYEELLSKSFRILLMKGITGVYNAEFSTDKEHRTEKNYGVGMVILMNGEIQGTDTQYKYSGSYSVLEDNKFTAKLTAHALHNEAESVFGKKEQEFTIEFEGTEQLGTIVLEGHRIDNPNCKIWANMTRQTRIDATPFTPKI